MGETKLIKSSKVFNKISRLPDILCQPCVFKSDGLYLSYIDNGMTEASHWRNMSLS